MKRLTALLIALILLIVPVAAESSFFDYTDDILEDGSLIYYFQELSLELPADWQGRVMAQQQDSGVCFYQKSSHEKYLAQGIDNGGFLFQLGASVNHSFAQLPKFEYLGFSEESAMNYYLRLPTDYPAYNEKEIREEYDKMASQIDYVVQHARFYRSGQDSASGTGSGTGSSGKDSGYDYSTEVPPKTSGAGSGQASIALPEAASADSTSGSDGLDSILASESADQAAASDTADWTQQDVRYFFEHKMLPEYFYDRPEDLLLGIYKTGLYPLWESVCQKNGVTQTYPASDYITHWYTVAPDTEFVQIEMPDPDAATLCYRIYIVYGSDPDKFMYYTLESDEFMPDTAYLCTWNREHEHEMVDAFPVLDRKSSGYADALKKEAEAVAKTAKLTGELRLDENALSVYDGSGSRKDDSGQTEDKKEDSTEKTSSTGQKDDTTEKTPSTGQKDDTAAKTDTAAANLQVINCPQQSFSTKADKSYSWDYQPGTGITIYTEEKDRIPYVIVFQAEDLIGEPFEYIKEQYTPHMKDQYGDDLMSFTEIDSYEIGGKKLPAGIYTYNVQGHLVEMVRIYDSTGKRSVAYTAKYLQGESEATLKALDIAVRNFEAVE